MNENALDAPHKNLAVNEQFMNDSSLNCCGMSRIAPYCHIERYVIVGTLVFLLGSVQFWLIYGLFDGFLMHATISWCVHFIVGTVWSHGLHRKYTFRNAPQVPYFVSLVRTYGSYLVMLGISTAMMTGICDVGGYPVKLGWLLTTIVLAVCNFTLMSRWTICRAPEGIKTP
jgi:putative flippase GtrA